MTLLLDEPLLKDSCFAKLHTVSGQGEDGFGSLVL